MPFFRLRNGKVILQRGQSLETEKNFESLKIRDINFDDEAELKTLAKLYVSVPLSWDSNYSFTEETVQKNYDWLLAKKDCLKCLVVTDQSKIVGIHILIKEHSSENCSIKTLWLEDQFRKQGIGSRLKQVGEDWAKAVGAKKMVTQVMSNNPAMFEINKKKGFFLTKFEMEKPLS